MTNAPQKLPEELQSALEDVRQMRDLVDRIRSKHPIRVIFRPLMYYSFVAAGVVVAFGVVAQLALMSTSPTVLGLPRTTFVWTLGLSLLGLLAASKWTISAVATKRSGYDAQPMLRKLFGTGYLRVIPPIMLLALCAAVALGQAGKAHQIVGVVTIAYGVALVAMPLVWPISEVTTAGLAAIVLGVVAMFVLPEYPFFKLAAIWGPVLTLMSTQVLRGLKREE